MFTWKKKRTRFVETSDSDILESLSQMLFRKVPKSQQNTNQEAIKGWVFGFFIYKGVLRKKTS